VNNGIPLPVADIYTQVDQLAPNKVHIRGLDNLTTDSIKHFAGEYYSLDDFQRVEWIDDTSANLIYESSEAAAEALLALSHLPDGPVAPLQVRRARALPSNPNVQLYIRQATVSDKKAPRAHERSRFYLMNPDHDPRERKGDYDNRPRAPRRDNRRPEAPKPFDVNMYDDAEEEEAIPSLSYEDDQDRRNARRRGEHARRPRRGDLFAAKDTGRLRDRSASPVRDGDGRYGFDQEQPERRTARRRTVSPIPRKRDVMAPARASNGPVELLPLKGGKTFGLDTPLTTTDSPKRNRELFPHKSARSNHRRSDALDTGETEKIRREYWSIV
jgi:hypothetical protein